MTATLIKSLKKFYLNSMNANDHDILYRKESKNAIDLDCAQLQLTRSAENLKMAQLTTCITFNFKVNMQPLHGTQLLYHKLM